MTQGDPFSSAGIRERYQDVNASFRHVLVYHIGTDTGFFTELSGLIHAMLFCLERHLQLRLYSDDANFGVSRGWTDYFLPFCPEVHEAFHSRLNHYRAPSWRQILRETPARQWRSLVSWKTKLQVKDWRGQLAARRAYGQPTWLSHHVGTDCFRHYRIPELGIEADYLQAFRSLVPVVWHLNEETRAQVDALKRGLALPPHYMGCQIRGGDKVTESDFIPPSRYIARFRKLQADHVFVLTDDYELFRQLLRQAPDIHWHTLCQPDERGYVNSQFSGRQGEGKRRQMERFFASMELLMQCDRFVGSIAPAPSHFLIKLKLPDAEPIDCPPAEAAEAVMHRIGYKAALARRYLQGQEQGEPSPHP